MPYMNPGYDMGREDLLDKKFARTDASGTGRRRDPHEYEPGDVTDEMRTDPDCRVCGQPRH